MEADVIQKNSAVNPEVYSEYFQTSKMERFAKIKLLTILAKCSILDVLQDSEYASEIRQLPSDFLENCFTNMKTQ